MLRARLTGFGPVLRALDRALERELEAAVTRAAERVAFTAKADHPYTDRTGDLTGSIAAADAAGSALEGTLRAAVGAGMEYASHVEARGYAFLEPALRTNEIYIETELERALEAAARRAGM